MARSRKFLTAGAVGVAALALIGSGASAVFQDSVTAQQTINTGSMNMHISSLVTNAKSDGKTLTLPTVGPFGSTFTTGPQTVTLSNDADITSSLATLEVSAPGNNQALIDGLQVKLMLGGNPVYNGPLAGLATSPAVTGSLPMGAMAAHTSVDAVVTFYANNLDTLAQGGQVTPTFKVGYKG